MTKQSRLSEIHDKLSEEYEKPDPEKHGEAAILITSTKTSEDASTVMTSLGGPNCLHDRHAGQCFQGNSRLQGDREGCAYQE